MYISDSDQGGTDEQFRAGTPDVMRCLAAVAHFPSRRSHLTVVTRGEIGKLATDFLVKRPSSAEAGVLELQSLSIWRSAKWPEIAVLISPDLAARISNGPAFLAGLGIPLTYAILLQDFLSSPGRVWELVYRLNDMRNRRAYGTRMERRGAEQT